MAPRIVPTGWGEIPGDDEEALPHPELGAGFLQKGFNLANDGDAAYDIEVEPFEIKPSLIARSKPIGRIAKEGSGFALVWLSDIPWSVGLDKWRLDLAMAKASEEKQGNLPYRPNYDVSLTIKYRDAEGFEYRTLVDLSFIPSQGRLRFGPPHFETISGPPSPMNAVDTALDSRPRQRAARNKMLVTNRADPQVEQIKTRVREFRKAGLTHREICNHLADSDRPPRAKWRNLAWPQAYKRYTGAVAKWLSDASR